MNKSNRYKNILKVLVICLLFPIFCEGKTKSIDPNERMPELDDLDFIEMLTSVDASECAGLIQKFQSKEAINRLLKVQAYKTKDSNNKEVSMVEFCRNKEVLLITIPADDLFGPNDTELKADVDKFLTPIRRYLKSPDMFRVLLVMHTDNTGSDEYRDRLTYERVNSVFDWFEDSGSNTSYLFSYAMGDEMPLMPNDTMEKRRKNRRLEIYLVPGTKMIEQAKKGSIAF